MSVTTTSPPPLSRAVSYTTSLEFVAGDGAELEARDGRRYLDCVSGYGVTNTGHCHPRVVAAIQEQAATLLHVSTVGRLAVTGAYAERLCALAPMPDAKVFFTNSGTEAVEAALKLVRYASGRPGVVSFGGGFHGRTLGSLSLTTSKASFRARHEPLPTGTYHVPYPRRELGPTLEAIDRLFVEQVTPERVAAFVVEPVLGEGGYVVPPAGFLAALRERCDRHGIILVVDEVQSGFGRTGRLFACQHDDVVPDLVTLAKGIASGVPMGALLGRAALLDAWEPGAHGTTFGGNPVACAAAGATLDALFDDGLIENAAARGTELLAGLREAVAAHPETLVEARGRGLMVGLETTGPEAATRIKTALLDDGVIVSTCGPDWRVLRFSPPLILSAAQVERVVAAVHAAA
jgi:4-aminobutyrate aminotransferase